jgi:hypothetical protein
MRTDGAPVGRDDTDVGRRRPEGSEIRAEHHCKANVCCSRIPVPLLLGNWDAARLESREHWSTDIAASAFKRISGNAEERKLRKNWVLRPEAEGQKKKKTHTHKGRGTVGAQEQLGPYFIVYRMCTRGSESDVNIPCVWLQ